MAKFMNVISSENNFSRYYIMGIYKTLQEAADHLEPDTITFKEEHPEVCENENLAQYATVGKPIGVAGDILSRSEMVGFDRNKNAVYRMPTDTGFLLIRGIEYGTLLVQEWDDYDLIEPILWTCMTHENFAVRYLHPSFQFIIHSHRVYGEEKLKKPDVLKGIPQAFSVSFIKKASCACFIAGDDLWIKHRDFFSSIFRPPLGDEGHGQAYYLNKYFNAKGRKKFIYDDNFASIVLRSEAWLYLKNMKQLANIKSRCIVANHIWDCMRKELNIDPDIPSEWQAFFEEVAIRSAEQFRSP